MPEIRPFRGLRFSAEAGAIETLVAPPYDVLSESERDAFAAKNPNNIVHATLPKGDSDDRSKYVKYAQSAAKLAEWRRNGVLALDDKPSLYRYTQSFTVPGKDQVFTRTKLVALLKTEPYQKGVVLPHEQTFPKHKEDRLRILEATRTHLESIYGLFEDVGGGIHAEIVGAPAETVANLRTDEGVAQRLDRITDPDVIAKLQSLLAEKRVWIADGHHRYETACTFRENLGEKPGLIAEDFMLMSFSSMADPGLVILPTHRIIEKMPVGPAKIEPLLKTRFATRRIDNSKIPGEIERLAAPDTRVLGLAMPGGTGLILTLENPNDAVPWVEGPGSNRLKELDVTILHRVIFEKDLELRGNDFFAYTRDPDEALNAVRDGKYAFFINAPTVEDMRVIALGGEKMPQKSTYYYPKLLSGLVLWSLADF